MILATASSYVPAMAQDELYPEGTLAPLIDLGLQPMMLEVPGKYRDQVPENLVLNLPPGFSVKVFAAGLRGPRLMAISPEGVLHVCNMRARQIVALPDRNRDGIADEHIVVMDDLAEAHSMAFYKGDLYVAEEYQVVRAIDADGDGIYEDREVFIGDIPFEGFHDTRTLVFDEQNDKAYLTVGSPCDLCRMDEGHQYNGTSTEDKVPYHPTRGTVLQYNADGSDRRIFATGVRNVIGLDFHPVTNELWGTNNGHDWEGRAIPPEWIDVLRDGDFLGYPLVHSHQVWNDFATSTYHLVLPITAQDTLLAQSQKKPVALVPAHWAPMGIHFYTGSQFPSRYKNAAFVAFRAGKAKLSSHPGYKVQALFSDPDGSNAVMADFLTGFQPGTTQDAVWGFPVGLMTDDEGSLYVTSDNRTSLILKVSHSLLGGDWQPDLPESVILAGPIDVRARVNIERLAEDGAAPRVFADLSALGGPAAVPLTESGTDSYLLDVQLTAEKVGAFEVVVRIEQDVDGRTESLQFIQTIDVVPPAWRHDLPGALVQGERITVSGSVRVDPFDANAGEPRVIADLSAIGGAQSILLSSAGDNVYVLDAAVEVAGPVGPHEILVRLEQEVAGVLRAFDFHHTIIIAPPDLAVLDDVLAGGWDFTGIDGASVLGPVADGPVFNGRVAHAVQAAPPSLFGNWNVDLQPETPVGREGFVGVRFAFHPGDVNIPRIPVLLLAIDEITLDLVRDPKPGLAIDLERREWQVLEIPFTAFDQDNFYGEGLRDQVDFVDRLRITGNLKGTFYLDDVRVVTSIPSAPPTQTVVAERQDDTRPAQFSLSQNYPNPFNSSTVIRFALSDPADVDLRVFNTAGQTVATLVTGPRPSGSHTVVWDGHADFGEALGSGVYFIRLTADTWQETQLQTRKLLLLR
jgi:glucose/arabinose dehydrogenase